MVLSRESLDTACSALASTVSHLQTEVTPVLEAAVDTRIPLNLLRVRVASDVARNFALNILKDLRTRASSLSYTRPWKSWDEKWLDKLADTDNIIVAPIEAPSQEEKDACLSAPAQDLLQEEKDSHSYAHEQVPSLKERDSYVLAPVQFSPQETTSSGLYTPAEIYDLAPRLLPRGQEWRWCEGACRLRGNASLLISDVSSPLSHVEGRIICKYCNRSGFEMPRDKAVGAEASRMLNFAIRCHVLIDGDEQCLEEIEGSKLVCHICINRNRYDGGAGPFSLEGLRRHVDKKHGGLKCIGV